MQTITDKLRRHIAKSGITVASICEKTGYTKNQLYPALAKSGKRDLRVDEFFAICNAISADPLNFTDKKS